MKFKFDNDRPIYIQLVEQLKLTIISGKIKPGEKLLSVRDLAIETKVNPNTMQKALTELETLNLIYTERTNGKFVTKDENLIEHYKNSYAEELTSKYLNNMNNLGYKKEEIISILKNLKGDKQ